MNYQFLFSADSNNQALSAGGVIPPWKEDSKQFYACPWLEARAQDCEQRKKDFWEGVTTLILLQDWGCADGDEKFEQAVDLVKPFFHEKETISLDAIKDSTLRNLWAEISAQTQGGSIVVTNAVWGLRPEGAEKTGYLGSVVHKAWFGNLLEKVIVPFLDQSQREPKKIIFCGEWARDWGAKEFMKLSEKSAKTYIQKYAKWANENYQDNPYDLKDDFQIYFFRHPSASGPWCPRSKSVNNLNFEEVDEFNW